MPILLITNQIVNPGQLCIQKQEDWFVKLEIITNDHLKVLLLFVLIYFCFEDLLYMFLSICIHFKYFKISAVNFQQVFVPVNRSPLLFYMFRKIVYNQHSIFSSYQLRMPETSFQNVVAI